MPKVCHSTLMDDCPDSHKPQEPSPQPFTTVLSVPDFCLQCLLPLSRVTLMRLEPRLEGSKD